MKQPQYAVRRVAQQQDEPGLREYADYLTGVNDVEGEPVYQRHLAVRLCVARQPVKIRLSETFNVAVRKVCKGLQAFVRISRKPLTMLGTASVSSVTSMEGCPRSSVSSSVVPERGKPMMNTGPGRTSSPSPGM